MRRGTFLFLCPMRRLVPFIIITDSKYVGYNKTNIRGYFNISSTLNSLSRPSTPIVSEDDYKLVPNRINSHNNNNKTINSTHTPTESNSESTEVNPNFSKLETPQNSNKSTSSNSNTSNSHYAPWEIRALLLPLIPVGGLTIPLRDIIYLLPKAAREEMQRDKGGPLEYIRRHLSGDVILNGNELSRRTLIVDSTTNNTTQNNNNNGKLQDKIKLGKSTLSPPPPPPPPLNTSRTQQSNSNSSNNNNTNNGGGGGAKTTLEVLDKLVEFIPTFFVQHQMVADQLPTEISKQYADSSFLFYLRRFRHYIDIRANHGNTEIRLRTDFSHPKRGVADTRYTTGLSGNDMLSQLARGRRPPRNSEANLIYFIVPRMPRNFTPIATVLQDVSDIVSRHPSFDPRLGVTGLFEKYPEYFQIVDAKLRVRPFRSAPNSLDDLDISTSPIPEIYMKVKELVDKYAEGKDYSVESEKAAAIVPTGKLYALLKNSEKKEVKLRCRSFPRFLRLHGAEIVVSVDNMKVYQFRPTYEKCAENIMDQRLTMSSLSPEDPVLKIPAAMDDNTTADWAVRELYDALPLMQCAELEEVISLVPPSVKNALPQEKEKLVEHLALYPDYFLTWPYPDNPSVTVIQRAKLEPMPMEQEDIARMIMPLIPQGGIDAEKLLRRVPLPLQRYLYRHGLKKVLGEMKNYFLVVGEKVMRIG